MACLFHSNQTQNPRIKQTCIHKEHKSFWVLSLKEKRKMHKKRERIPKKGGRGRPRKRKVRQESTEDDDDHSLTQSSNSDSDSQPFILSQCFLANASSTVSRYRTRRSQAVADEQALGLKRLNTMEYSSSKSPIEEALDVPSQREIISPVKTTDTLDCTTVSSKTESPLIFYKNPLNLDKFTSDILVQPRANNELVSDHINVEGYKVKRELAPLVKAIFTKYGDICKESTFSLQSRSFLLEWVCSIYNKLEASAFLQLTSSEVESMLGQMKDLEGVKVEIGWLSRRLSQISKAREMYGGFSTIEDVEARMEVVIGEKTKAIESYEKKVEAGMEAVKKLQAKLEQEKDELGVFDEVKKMCAESLVHGLV